jgi:DNA-binding NarL/FixJ family response regulator
MPYSETITVGIIDDNRLVREALASMLDDLPDVRVVDAPVSDAPRHSKTKPQVLLLDERLGDHESKRVAASLKHETPDAKIIVMDFLPLSEEIVEFVNAGVSGFVLQDAGFDELVGTIRAVASGEKVLPPRMTEPLFSQMAREANGNGRAGAVDDVHLTRREREVVAHIGAGLSNREIAEQLDIATHTVKSHVRTVMEKLALHTRLLIAAYAHRQGITQPT